jgi:hypothetical protein
VHQVGDLFELNVKLRCQNVKEGKQVGQRAGVPTIRGSQKPSYRVNHDSAVTIYSIKKQNLSKLLKKHKFSKDKFGKHYLRESRGQVFILHNPSNITVLPNSAVW